MQPRAPLPTSAAAPPTPAPPAAAPLATPFPAIVALCEDQALLREVAVAIGEQAGIISTPTPDRFVDQLVANCAEVALIDTAIVPNGLTAFLGRLRRQFPHVRILLLGAAAPQEGLRGQIANGTVFGFAQQPASAERLKLLLLAALRAAPPETTPGTGGADDAPGTATIPITAPVTAPATARVHARPRWLWPLLLCLLTLGAMIVGWFASSFASQRHLLP